MVQPIADLFNRIAGSYDKLNHLFSLGIDRGWRRRALKGYISKETGHVLDVACGTADLSIELVRHGAGRVTGVDISEGMLAKGRTKVKDCGMSERIELALGDCAELKYTDATFDAATVAFGIRNFSQRAKSLEELYRVIKPGGKLIILEFSTPRHFPVKQLYRLYFMHIMPALGGWLSGDRAAYEYLPRSVYAFPQGEAFLSELKGAGFIQTSSRRLSCGIASVYWATRPSD